MIGGWVLATAVGSAVVYGLVPYLNEEQVPVMNSFVRVFYGSFNRLAWSLAVGWLIFACVHGYGGPVNRFLSWKIFIPLSRLTYVVYLVHVNYLLVWSANLRQPVYYTALDHVQFFLGVVFGVTLLAFGISLTVEIPILNLEKLVFSSSTSASNAYYAIFYAHLMLTVNLNSGNSEGAVSMEEEETAQNEAI